MRDGFSSSIPIKESTEVVTLRGEGLTIDEVVRVSSRGARVRLTDEHSVLHRVQASCDFIAEAVERGTPIYGVTTCFGGMADVPISSEEAADLQNNAIWLHRCGAGRRLPV